MVSALHINHKPKKIIVFSRDEKKQHDMANQLGAIVPELRFRLGDVRDRSRVKDVLRGVDYVFHLAAMKHIPRCKSDPIEAVKTNVNGTINVIEGCLHQGVKRAVFTSTDKAVEPCTHYGATKQCGEYVWLEANQFGRTAFHISRYGNVLNSRGSVIELFLNLKAQGIREFPLTHPDMTRFWMTLPEAAETVIAALCGPVKVLIPRIPSMKIIDLARVIDPECTFTTIGLRAGEKIHECLVSPNERVPGLPEGYYSNANELWLSANMLREKLGL